jgi:hypothetical protein
VCVSLLKEGGIEINRSDYRGDYRDDYCAITGEQAETGQEYI